MALSITHYVTKEKPDQSLPLRFVTSGKARVEIYDFEGKPLAIDAQGNGSLHDRGDELFAESVKLLRKRNGAKYALFLLLRRNSLN